MLPIYVYLKNPSKIALGLLSHLAPLFPDKLYLKLRFRLEMGKTLNLKNPQTFNEKLQWLKLYNRKPEYTMMVDKFSVKKYVAEMIGEQYVVPTLGVWNRPEDIDWDGLPNQFVLKTTHSGGGTGVIICKDKQYIDKKEIIKKLNKSLKSDIYLSLREWPYKNVPRKIIAEKYIQILSELENEELVDYKFFCFNGEPLYCQIISGRDSMECIDFFDMDWHHQPFHEPKIFPFANKEFKKPLHFEEMCLFAKKLSYSLPFLRVDFYDTLQHLYFGELTFFPTSGMGGFDPSDWDKYFGSKIQL